MSRTARQLSPMIVTGIRERPVRITNKATGENVAEDVGAFVRGGKLRVAERNGRLVAELTDLAVGQVTRTARGVHEITLATGDVWLVEVTGRCACGSPLQRLDPWRGT